MKNYYFSQLFFGRTFIILANDKSINKMNMTLAYQKLLWIQQECGGNEQKPSSSLDKSSFEFQKRTMHISIKEIRKVFYFANEV